MVNIKNIVVTSSISILFSFFSIHNLLEYYRILNAYYIRQINLLQLLLNKTILQYDDLNQKYIQLKQNNENNMQEIEILKHKIFQLTNDINNEDYYKKTVNKIETENNKNNEFINIISQDYETIDYNNTNANENDNYNANHNYKDNNSRSNKTNFINTINYFFNKF